MYSVEAPQRAIVVQRKDPAKSCNTEEIYQLSKSANYNVVDRLSQNREEDFRYNIGSGKVRNLIKKVERNNIDTIIFGNLLTPQQKYNLGVRLPTPVKIVDKCDLILKIFEERAQTRKSQLQVELAQLRYELPKVDEKIHLAKKDERPGFMGLGEYDENRKEDIKDRIGRIKSELDNIKKQNKRRIENRRSNGFNIVSMAGYTNAGKSTLFQRLSESLEVGENNDKHPDISPTAPAKRKMFSTLDTTTRRMDFQERKVLLTDTVGIIGDIPPLIVDSFRSTFDSIYLSCLVLIVVDVSDNVRRMREKIVKCQDILFRNKNIDSITVFNKIDKISDEELERKKSALDTLCPNRICVSASTGENIEQLKEQMHNSLPNLQRERLLLPINNRNMSLISDIHKCGNIVNKTFNGSQVLLEFEAPDKTVKKIRGKIDESDD